MAKFSVALAVLSLLSACGAQPSSEKVAEKSIALAGPQTYSTNFDLTENPISEGGKWVNGKALGLDWTNVKTVSGIAKGNSNFPDWWRDSTALLAGTWPPDQTATATVWCHPNHDDEHLESELRLRSELSAHSCSGYEVLFNCNSTASAYQYIVRWNGPEKDFTILVQQDGAAWGVKDGDVVSASVVGNVITAYVNGVQRMQAIDDVYTSGAPGIGFDHNATGSNDDLGFSQFSVTATEPGGPSGTGGSSGTTGGTFSTPASGGSSNTSTSGGSSSSASSGGSSNSSASGGASNSAGGSNPRGPSGGQSPTALGGTGASLFPALGGAAPTGGSNSAALMPNPGNQTPSQINLSHSENKASCSLGTAGQSPLRGVALLGVLATLWVGRRYRRAERNT